MSGIAGLSLPIINAITGNLPISNVTRAELRNFLQGRITTVTKEEEFTQALRGLTQDIEVGSVLPEGTATGEILGALEGGALVGIGAGVIVGKGLEIASELYDLARNTRDEQIARNRLRDQIQQDLSRGIIHGGMGNPSREVSDLIRQQLEQSRFEEEQTTSESEREFKFGDPIRQRKKPVTDSGFEDQPLKAEDPFEDVPLDDPDDDPQQKARRPRPPISIDPIPILPGKKRTSEDPLRAGRRPFVPPETPEPPAGQPRPSVTPGDLRADFKMLGTDYFNSLYVTPMAVQNSEWVEFDYVDPTEHGQNLLQMSNILGDAIRFSEPLFRPVYQPPLKPPTSKAVTLSFIPMRREIQLTQPFVDKFDKADMGKPMQFTETYSRSAFDFNFERLRLYNPV